MAPDVGGRDPTTEPASAPYTPFPDFATWHAQAVDLSTADRFFESLDEARAELGSDAMRAAVEVATKWAAVDTGAIEGLYEVDRGFTYSVAVEAAAWEAIAETRGEPVKRAIEDAVAGYDFVLDAATRSTPLSEKWIRELHATICRSQTTYRVRTAVGWQDRELVPGRYKTEPNNPTRHDGSVFAFAPVDETAPEMARLIEELRSPAFQAAHPVEQASYAHYAFVRIHPFADGNGRVARALASVFLYRRPGIPLVVFADQRAAYLDALELADAGLYDELMRFLARRVIDAVELLQLQAHALTKRPASIMAELRDLLGSSAGPSAKETEAMASLLLDNLSDEFDARAKELRLPSHVRYKRRSSTSSSPPPGYRFAGVAFGPSVYVTISTEMAGRAIHVTRNYSVFASTAGTEPGFAIAVPGPDHPLRINLGDVYPTPGTTLAIKLRTWVQGELATLLEEFRDTVRAALGKSIT